MSHTDLETEGTGGGSTPGGAPEPSHEAGSGEELRVAAAHGLRWYAISRPTVEILQLISVVVLARLIAPAEFGRFAIAVIAQEVALLLVTAGLSIALVQRKTLEREHEQTGMAIALLSGVALAGVTIALAGPVVAPIFGERTAHLVVLMAPMCLIEAFATVPVVTLRRSMRFRRLSELEILNTVVRVAVAVGLALAGLGGEALVYGIVAGAFVAMAVAWASAPPPAPRLHRAATRVLLGPAMRMWVATISWLGFSNVDYAIIGARLGPLPNGYYYRAYTLAVEYQSKVTIMMYQVGFPVLARTSSQGELAQLYRLMIRLLTIALFPVLVLLAIMAPVLVPFLFGPKWNPAVVPAQILALGGASTIIFNAVKTVFMAGGRSGALIVLGWTQFIVYGVTVWFVVDLGITAIAIDAAIVHGLFAILAYSLMLRGTGEPAVRRMWSDMAPATVSSIALVAVTLPVSMLLTAAHVPSVPWLIAVGLVAIPPYLLTLRTFFPSTWRTQCATLARVLPGTPRLTPVKRRLTAAATAAH
jgi:PST family polysaccharide transporter